MKKVAVYTSTRADYGLLRPLISRLSKKSQIDLRLFVTGTHLSEKYGFTVSEIEKDHKNLIYYRAQHLIDEDPQLKTLSIMTDAMRVYAENLVQDSPDISIVLGDRYEALCYGIACATLRIPMVHIHGGEVTLGALDDKYRHCLTKLAEWHFVSCEKYRKRVIQLGENPDHVFNVGALGVDNALNTQLMSREELEKNLNCQLPEEFYLMTIHPETNANDHGSELVSYFLMQLENRLLSTDTFVLVTGVNNDPGAQIIRDLIVQFVSKMGKKALFVESLGVVRYLSLMKLATAVLGNSSSGVLEAHSMKTPSVNIGLRQDGRERESSVLDFVNVQSLSELNFDTLVGLKKELQNKNNTSIFGNGRTSDLMAIHLTEIIDNLHTLKPSKSFFDIGD